MSTAVRRLEVLRAIVVEYVKSHEPVSSKAVARSYVTGVSSATIRNDMGALELAGLIRQPHTSAGRVPTESGYRVFVDRLRASASQVARDRRDLAERLTDVDTVEEAVQGTARALANITGQAAVVEYPDIVADRLRRVELIDLTPSRFLVIVITISGKVFERIVEFAPPRTDLDLIRDRINARIEGIRVDEVGSTLAHAREAVPKELHHTFDQISAAVTGTLEALETTRIVTAGAANLARAGIDPLDVAEVLDLLEDRAALLDVFRGEDFGDEDRTDSAQISIGTENRHQGLTHAALISTVYEGPSPSPNHVGVIGPTRMDYARSLAAVEAVSGYLSRLLLRKSGDYLAVPSVRREMDEVRETGEDHA